jgi:hypothetical protein
MATNPATKSPSGGGARSFPSTVETYQTLVRELSAEAFEHRYPHPFVLFSPNTLLDEAMRFASQQGLSSEGTNIAVLDALPGKGYYMSPVIKKPNDTSDVHIFLGREKTNDIVIPVRSVSNQHCKFAPPSQAGEKWLCRDLGSKNGSFLDGQRMIPGAAYELKNSSRLELGQDIVAWFFDSPAVWAMLREPNRLPEFFDQHR